MPQHTSLQFTEIDYSPCETARRVAAAARVSFALAVSCVEACGGDYGRALAEAQRQKKGGR